MANQLVSVLYSTRILQYFKVLRPLGIDITVIVDVFNTMTQAQVDLQNQLEQATADLTTRPLLNDSPVLYIDTSEQIPTTSLEQMEQEKIEPDTTKVSTPLNDIDHTHATPPPPKKPYEIMKDPVFLSSPIYPPFISTNTSLSTNRDDHLISLLSHDNFIFKAQLTSLYMHPTDYSFRLYDKNQDFFTSIASKIMGPYQYWLDNGVKIFSLLFNFFVHLYMFQKQTNLIRPFSLYLKNLLIIKHTLNFYSTQNQKITFSSITNIHHPPQ